MSDPSASRGFTLIEAIVVVAIMAMMMVYMFPNIMNSIETRNLDNSARDIQTTLEQARYRSIDEKAHYRIRFAESHGVWYMHLEDMDATGNWVAATRFQAKSIDSRFVVAFSLPAGLTVEFSPVGVVEAYDSTHNSLSLQSPKLKAKKQPDLRILTVFGGGTIRYQRATSG